MSTNSIFNRTVKTNIVIYPANGMGRDGYITYNNAGFWKKNIKQIVPKETFGRPPFAVFHSLKNIPPIWTYYSDGSGRDSYVYYNNGGLKREYTPLAKQNLQKFLREKMGDNRPNQRIFLSKDEKIYLNKINQIQKNLVDRLYNKYKNRFLGNTFKNNNRYSNNRDYYFNNNNNLYRSSSQIMGKQTLDPIKKYNNFDSNNSIDKNDYSNNNNNLMLSNKLKSNSQNNIFENKGDKTINFKKINFNTNLFTPQNGNIKIKNKRRQNNNPWYYKREYIYNSVDNKLEKHPKIKCSLSQINMN